MLYQNCPYLCAQCKEGMCPCVKYNAYKDATNPEVAAEILKKNNFDINQSTWDLLYAMQTHYTLMVRKKENLTKSELDLWLNRYLVSMEDEIREVRESLDIYSPNTKQIATNNDYKKEIIDVVHFMLDLFIAAKADSKVLKKYYNQVFDTNITEEEDLFEAAYRMQKDTIEDYLFLKFDCREYQILKASCKLLDANAKVRKQISWKHWKKPSETIDYEELYKAFAYVLHEYVNLASFFITPAELKTLYVEKNVENILRQEYGY